MVSKTLTPVSAARADTNSDLKKCLDIVKTAADAATSVADAIADPTYLACTAQIAALNPVAIGMAAAVTAFYALNSDAFNNPAECNGLLAKTMLGFIADKLSDLLNDTEGLLYKLLKGTIGEDGINLIKDIAGFFGIDYDAQISAAKDEAQKQSAEFAKQQFDDLMKELTTALGPVMMQLQCGCAVAGTVAIIKNAAEGVADAGGACLNLLSDPGALLNAFLDDPIGVLGTVGQAVCDGVAEVADICGQAKAMYEFAGDVIDAACSVPGVCATVEAVAETIACWFSDCDDPAPPPAPPQCPPSQWLQASNGGIGSYCVCSAPMGKVTSSKQIKYTDMGDFQAGKYAEKEETVVGITCKECSAGYGINAKGFCEKCVTGFTSKNKDGSYTEGAKCTATYECESNEHYKADNSGCYSCPEGQKFDTSNKGCWPVCDPKLVNDSKSGQCVCPPSADGKPQQLVGQNLDTCSVLADCDPSYMSYVYLDAKSNTCAMRCPDPRQYYGTTNASNIEVKSFECLWCPDGQVAVDNVCTDFSGFGAFVKCGDNEIHGNKGNCTPCEAGTEKGAGNTCEPVCPEGSEFNPEFKNSLKGTTTNWKASVNKLIDGQSVVGAGQMTAGQIAGTNNASAPSGPPKPPYCSTCGENEESLTLTMAGNGYAVTERVCVKCAEGLVSKPGGRCYNPIAFQTTSLTPQAAPNSGIVAAPRAPDRNTLKAKTYTPEELGKPSTGGMTQKPKDKGKNTGTAALPKTDPGSLKGTAALPKQAKPTCPPGQIQEGGRCVLPRTTSPTPQAPQLSMPSMGGGSSVPGFQAPSAAAPSGTAALPKQSGGGLSGTTASPKQSGSGLSGTTALPRQSEGGASGTAAQPRQSGGGVSGTAVLPRSGGGLQGTPVLPQGQSGNSKPF